MSSLYSGDPKPPPMNPVDPTCAYCKEPATHEADPSHHIWATCDPCWKKLTRKTKKETKP